VFTRVSLDKCASLGNVPDMSIWDRILSAGRAIFESTEARSLAPAVVSDVACAPDPGDVGFTAAVVGLGAKLAKADGRVTDDEVAVFARVFRADPKDWPAVKRVFNLARQTVRGYEAYARRIARRYSDRPCLLEGIMDGLFHIAVADGVITGDEMDYLRTVSEAFGFNEDDFRRIRASHLGPDPEDPYLILGVGHDASFDAIRQRYRKLMADHHPDRVIMQGAPREFEVAAHAKAASITSAFARIKAERGYLIRTE